MALYMKSKNLIPFPYLITEAENASGTATLKVGADGALIFNGNTANGSIFAKIAEVRLSAGTYYLSWNANKEVADEVSVYVDGYRWSDGAFTLTEDTTVSIYAMMYKEQTCENLVLKPMLNRGATALPYEKGGGTKVRLARKSNNLIRFPYQGWFEGKVGVAKTHAVGITITVQEDGGVKVQGTATAEVFLNFGFYDFAGGAINTFNNAQSASNANYTFSENKEAAAQGVGLHYGGGSDRNGNKALALRFYKGNTYDCIVYPMLNKGKKPLSYEQGSKPVYLKIADNSDNLIPFPYAEFEKLNVVQKNGLTFTQLEDGGIKIQGTNHNGYTVINLGKLELGVNIYTAWGQHSKNGYTVSYNDGKVLVDGIPPVGDKPQYVMVAYTGDNSNNLVWLRCYENGIYDCVVYPKITKFVKK